MAELIQRRVEEIARQRMTEAPVLLLHGPRSVGKSTLLRALAGGGRAGVIDLDDPAVRANVADDPGLFVSGHPPVFTTSTSTCPSCWTPSRLN